MMRWIVFLISSFFLIGLSRKSLLNPGAHGFYRFFAWECILALVLLNLPYWFRDPFSLNQLVSWFFLMVSIVLVAIGMHLLRKIGKPDRDRADDKLIAFEKTSTLVTVGVYKYIRHPLYSSLLFLAWGAFLKHLSGPGLALAFSSTFFLFLTAKRDEAECLEYFGDVYRDYAKRTRRFVPFLF